MVPSEPPTARHAGPDPVQQLTATLVVRVCLAWIPFLVLWTLFMLGYVEGNVRAAVTSAFIATSTAAVLGVVVWAFTGRYPWPDKIRLAFYGVHALGGTLYALTWTALATLITILMEGEGFSEITFEIQFYSWRLLLGYWLYVMLVGISYALRNWYRLRRQERIAARAQALAAEARLNALRAQLHPHFLFNALHSVSALIRFDPPQAEIAMEQLGDLLRYTLNQHDKDLVSLNEEWAFTRGYLDLQQLRFGEKLRVRASIDDTVGACLVPSFTIQPIVENAIHHGIADRPEGGTIEIDIRLTPAALVIAVVDDGPGLEEAPASAGHGHGLPTLHERLAALYGADARLQIETGSKGGLTVTMTLPRLDTDEVEKGHHYQAPPVGEAPTPVSLA